VTKEKKTKPSKATGQSLNETTTSIHSLLTHPITTAGEEKEKSKVTKAKEIYEDSGERAIAQLINTNDRIQVMLLEKVEQKYRPMVISI